MINTAIFVGNAGSAPRVKVFQTGKKVAHLSVAVNQFAKGDTQPEPLWMDCEFWDALADNLIKCEVDKGRQIGIEGSLSPNVYQDKVGEHSITIKKVKVKVQRFQLFGRASSQDAEQAEPSDAPLPEPAPGDVVLLAQSETKRRRAT